MLHLSTIFVACYVPSYERLRKSVVAYEESRPLTLALTLTRTRCFVSVSASPSLLEMISQASLQASLVTKKFVSDEPWNFILCHVTHQKTLINAVHPGAPTHLSHLLASELSLT